MVDDRIAEICQQMREIRSELRDDAAMIVENAKLTVDWRNYVERYPWAWVGTAVAIGYFVVPRGSPRFALERSHLNELASRIQAVIPQSAAATKEQGKGFLIGVALPLLAKLAMQGGLAMLQHHIFGAGERGKSQPPRRDPESASMRA